MNCITLTYGAADPLVLEVPVDALVADCRGPEGVRGEAAAHLVMAGLDGVAAGPPLGAHVVPGDRVVVALAGGVPREADVVPAVIGRLEAAGVAADDVLVFRCPPLDAAVADAFAGRRGATDGLPGRVRAADFDPDAGGDTAYLAADEEGRPLHLARTLVDADVVVAIGGWGWDSAVGGRSVGGELWPVFSRRQARHDLARQLAKRGRHALPSWRAIMREINRQLGVCASLRIVAGTGDSVAAVAFGPPDASAHAARAAASAWAPEVGRTAMLSIASLSDPAAGLGSVTRAVASAARVTHAAGTICVVGRLAEPPGLIFSRWRQGAPLEPLVHEAIGTSDPAIIADALLTRLFARALGDRRLVLLSDLDEGVVEELEFGYATSPEVVERLAHRAESVIVLREAERLLPSLA
ncbi:MAG: hypothetical protein EBZ59_00765 [Planctomycetia bacterium]|nr:hypothetical protein [Planctomycetia bacterium]